MTDPRASDRGGGFQPWSLARRDSAARWRRVIFPGIWLIYLSQTAHGISQHSSGWGLAAGFAVLAAFCVCYLAALPFAWAGQHERFWIVYAAALVLVAIETVFAHEDAFVMLTFVAVLTVGALGARSIPVLALFTVVAIAVPPAVRSWHAGLDFTPLITITLVGLAMYSFFGLIRSNRELAEARSEVARLAAENERTRIARDLHDLLGHSLTTITVKAGLARRLAERHDERATTEIAEVEELSRRSLADVRAAVAGHRDVTLAGELATAREVLRAAGIVAELPGSVEVVDPSLSELFGWVVREGVTNVVRHARASHCAVRVDRGWIEITDNGRAGIAGSGNGLTGLRERVEAASGTVQVGAAPYGGWRLRVDVPVESVPGSRPAAEPARETPTMTP
jgi:two-component system, NarL family, sensor histidine kinase DesK